MQVIIRALCAQNWIGSGSRHANSSSNLFVGRTLSGSMAEFRAWNTVLSASKFKQHILNKFSTVGHSISSSRDDLIYHYKYILYYNLIPFLKSNNN